MSEKMPSPEKLKKIQEENMTDEQIKMSEERETTYETGFEAGKHVGVYTERLKTNPVALKNAPEKLKSDKGTVLKAIEMDGDTKYPYSPMNVFQYASEELRNDKEVARKAAEQDYRAFKYASPELQDDKEFVLEVIKINGCALEYASKKLQADKEVVLAAIKRRGDAFNYASNELKNNKDVVLTAVQENGWVLNDVPEKFKADKEIVLEAIKSYRKFDQKRGRIMIADVLRYSSPELLVDREFILEAMKINYNVICHVSPKIKADKDFMLSVAKEYGKDIVLEAIMSDVPDSIRKDIIKSLEK